MKISAIIPAAGRGLRMGGEISKPFISLDGKPIIVHTLEFFQECRSITEIFLVVSPDNLDFCEKEIVRKYKISKVKKIIPGGKERQDSVFEGLKSLAEDVRLVMVHDGVRPFVEEKMIEDSLLMAADMGGAVVALPVKDTIKAVEGETIIRTLDRSGLYRIQTPQTFRKDLLLVAFEKAQKEGFYGTDESSLVEKLGVKVGVVRGSEFNLKITTPEDMVLAEAIVRIKMGKFN